MVIIRNLKNIVKISPLVLILACGGNQTSQTNTAETKDSLEVESLQKDKKSFNYILPSPMQIASMFHKAKLKFSFNLLNKVDNVGKYNTETKRVLNIGVYGADLAFCLLNNQNQSSLNYLKAAKTLSDNIGMGSVYESDNIVNRFQNNINNLDTLTDIVSTIQTDSESYLEENDKRFTALSIFTGGWVEALYLTTTSLEKNYNEKLTIEISEQHVSLANLLKLLNEHNESKGEEFKTILAGLNEIDALYVKSADYIAKAVTLEEGEVPFDFKLSEKEIKLLAAKTNEIRSYIVN